MGKGIIVAGKANKIVTPSGVGSLGSPKFTNAIAALMGTRLTRSTTFEDKSPEELDDLSSTPGAAPVLSALRNPLDAVIGRGHR